MARDDSLALGTTPRPPVTLLKFLCNSLGLNKSGARELLSSGQIRVNGLDVSDEHLLVYPDEDTVVLDGVSVQPFDRLCTVVFAVHKPKGMDVGRSDKTIASAAKGRRGCFASWLGELCAEADVQRLFPIGRLDKDTSGLLLVTNDGDLSYACCRPGRLSKTYVAESRFRMRVPDDGVEVRAPIASDRERDASGSPHAVCSLEETMHAAAAQLMDQSKPIQLPDGPVSCEHAAVLNFTSTRREIPPHLLQDGGPKLRKKREQAKALAESESTVKSTIHCGPDAQKPQQALAIVESRAAISATVRVGRFRVVRRVLAAVGLPVAELHRSAFGPLQLVTPAALKGQAVALGHDNQVPLVEHQLAATQQWSGSRDLEVHLALNAHCCLSTSQVEALWWSLFGSRGSLGVEDRQVAALRRSAALGVGGERLLRWLAEHGSAFCCVEACDQDTDDSCSEA